MSSVKSEKPFELTENHIKELSKLTEEQSSLVIKALNADMKFVNNPKLYLSDTEIFNTPEPDVMKWVPQAIIGHSNRVKFKGLSKEDEVNLFLRYNYARMMVCDAVDGFTNLPSEYCVNIILKWYPYALRIESKIAEANLGLSVEMVARYCSKKTATHDEMVTEANFAILRSIKLFDVKCGYKFSTYACNAIIASLSRINTKEERYQDNNHVQYDPIYDKPTDYEHGTGVDDQELIKSMYEVIENSKDFLDLEKRMLLSTRTKDKYTILSEMRTLLGGENAAAKASKLWCSAISKLRKAMILRMKESD